MRVAVLGRTRILYEAIDRLIEAGHQIVLIGTCHAAPEYDIVEKDFSDKAAELGCLYFNDVKINSASVVSLLHQAEADVAVSINWITIIGGEAINSFRYGILNAHCGDLPRYRGNACPNWAIINGENEYGICIHFMNPGELDNGDVVVRRKYVIHESTTITDIYNRMENVIPDMFCEALLKIENKEEYESQSTEPADALRCYPRIPSDSIIRWEDSCEDILKLINASCAPFEGAYTFYNNHKIFIHKASMIDFAYPSLVMPGQVIFIDKLNHFVGIAAGDGVIKVEEVVVDGRKSAAVDILYSTRIRLNYNIQEELFILNERMLALENELNTLKETAFGTCN